jgi:hypothetical protein
VNLQGEGPGEADDDGLHVNGTMLAGAGTQSSPPSARPWGRCRRQHPASPIVISQTPRDAPACARRACGRRWQGWR